MCFTFTFLLCGDYGMDYGQMRKWHMRYAHSPYWASWMRFSSFYVLFDYYYYFTFNILVLRMIIGQYHIYIRECGLAINRIGFDVYQISEIRLKPTKLKKLYSYACAHLSIFRFLIVVAGRCFCFFLFEFSQLAEMMKRTFFV